MIEQDMVFLNTTWEVLLNRASTGQKVVGRGRS